MSRNSSRFAKRRLVFLALIGLVSAMIIEALSFALLYRLRSTGEFDIWKKVKLKQQNSYMTWFDDQYKYHPYLGYASTDNEGKQAEVHGTREVTIAIIGGSFAQIFASFLEYEPGTTLLNELARELHVDRIHTLNLAAGGYRQPQQMISSLLWYDKADIFVSIEGFNEISSPQSRCLPISWSHQSLRFDPRIFGNYKMVMFAIKRLYAYLMPLADSWFSTAQLAAYGLTSLFYQAYSALEAQALGRLNEPATCGQFKVHPFISIEQEMMARIKYWISSMDRHHMIFKDDGNKSLITVMQPNQYLPHSKPWSQDEEKIFNAFDIGWAQHIVKYYPIARASFLEKRKRNRNLYDFTQIYKDHSESLYVDDCCHVGEAGNRIFFENLKVIIKPYVLKALRQKNQGRRL